MTLGQAIEIAIVLFKTRICGRKIPLFAAWNITFRCNLNCQYCGVNTMSTPELDTHVVLERLDQLWDLGVRWITFGGGEPLIREDIGVVLGYAKHKGFQVYLSTNGWLAAQRAEAIRVVDHINLSLDGDRDAHDHIRGQGAFDKAIESIEVFQRLGLSVSLLCVLSQHNLDQIQEVISIALKFRLLVMFQPSTVYLNKSLEKNPISPPIDAYRQAIAFLIELKRDGAPIRNSVTGLKHLAKWPEPTQIWCPAGVLMLVMEPNGTLAPCRLAQFESLRGNHNNALTMKKEFANLKMARNCRECWCATLVEVSLLMSLKPEPLWNAFRLLA
jgi:MoaA/NifB/PqqE/SkfB family radical SAM enzyme